MFDFQKECGLKLIKDLVEGEENISRIYGFILYTEQDPYVIKVLQDDDFWNSLDSISGNNWPIFSARPLKKGQMEVKGAGQGFVSFLVPTWHEPQHNWPILHEFGLDSSEDLPLFIAFMWDDNDELNQISVPIRGDSINSVYASIKEIVKTISRVERDILPEFKRSVNVFRNVENELKALNYKYRVKRMGKIMQRIADFFSVFTK